MNSCSAGGALGSLFLFESRESSPYGTAALAIKNKLLIQHFYVGGVAFKKSNNVEPRTVFLTRKSIKRNSSFPRRLVRKT